MFFDSDKICDSNAFSLLNIEPTGPITWSETTCKTLKIHIAENDRHSKILASFPVFLMASLGLFQNQVNWLRLTPKNIL